MTKQVLQQALEALELAVRQNSHDMLMTGEEIRKGESAIEALREALAQQGEQQPTVEAAHKLGEKGAEPTEAERLLFESWMRGHCWSVIGDWDGKTYVHADEVSGWPHAGAMNTRQLWAAWRDRAALAAAAIEKLKGGE